MLYFDDNRYGEVRNLTFGSNKYLKIYLALQEYTGLNQKELLKWIDEVCDRLEAKHDLQKKSFNRKSKGRAAIYGRATEGGGQP